MSKTQDNEQVVIKKIEETYYLAIPSLGLVHKSNETLDKAYEQIQEKKKQQESNLKTIGLSFADNSLNKATNTSPFVYDILHYSLKKLISILLFFIIFLLIGLPVIDNVLDKKIKKLKNIDFQYRNLKEAVSHMKGKKY